MRSFAGYSRSSGPQPADLVELGAAPGVQCIALAREGYRVTAVDLGELRRSGETRRADRWPTHSPERGSTWFSGISKPRRTRFRVSRSTRLADRGPRAPSRLPPERARRNTAASSARWIARSYDPRIRRRLQNRARLLLGRSVHTPLRTGCSGSRTRDTPAIHGLRATGAGEGGRLGRRSHLRSPLPRQKRPPRARSPSLRNESLDSLARLHPSFGSGLALLAARPPHRAIVSHARAAVGRLTRTSGV